MFLWKRNKDENSADNAEAIVEAEKIDEAERDIKEDYDALVDTDDIEPEPIDEPEIPESENTEDSKDLNDAEESEEADVTIQESGKDAADDSSENEPENDSDDEDDDFGPAPESDLKAETTEPVTESVQEKETPEESKETPEERAARIEKRNALLKKIGKTAGITAGIIAAIYLAGTAFYSTHFFFGTRIGNYKCSNMSAAKAEEKINSRLKEYRYTVYERGGNIEYIKGSDIGFKVEAREDMKSLKKKQNPFAWPLPWVQRIIPMEAEVTVNEMFLKNAVGNLHCVKQSREQIDGALAGLYFDEGDKTYHIKDDGTHSIVSENALNERILAGIKGLYVEINLEEEGLYGGLEKDDTINNIIWSLNNYLNATITYEHGDTTHVLDRGTIHTWLSVNEDGTINISDEGVAAYVSELAGLYNTVGGTRTFTGSGGAEVSISGGDYGWKVDQQAEAAALKQFITEGQPVTREPEFSRRAGSFKPGNDLPNSYVEVSIAAQHLWCYKDGQIVVSSDVVTGNPLRNNGTHTGTFYIKYKAKNATLKGEDYETPVGFWMPFNGGEGLHDANWRGAFGGSIYRGGGSHGCVNCPVKVAEQLYGIVEPGMPVVVY